MALCVSLIRVADFDVWREVYDSAAPLRASGGVTAESVHRMAGDPDNVLVISHFDSVAAAQAFFANPDLLDAMERAGVKAERRIEFYD